MSNTYTWSIKKMTAHAKEGNFESVVHSVGWECSATDDVNTVVTSGTQSIAFDESSSFTAANNLTEQMVVEWVQSAMGDTVQASTKEQLDALLQEKAQPKTVEVSLPWMAS
jgi:hypothetical protein